MSAVSPQLNPCKNLQSDISVSAECFQEESDGRQHRAIIVGRGSYKHRSNAMKLIWGSLSEPHNDEWLCPFLLSGTCVVLMWVRRENKMAVPVLAII